MEAGEEATENDIRKQLGRVSAFEAIETQCALVCFDGNHAKEQYSQIKEDERASAQTELPFAF